MGTLVWVVPNRPQWCFCGGKLGDRMTTVWLVIPCYNENEIIRDTANQLALTVRELMGRGVISHYSKILFVNDGSKDGTWEIIEALHKENPVFEGIDILKNTGQQNALMAGLMSAREYVDAAITLDADLQDDIKVIEKFLDNYHHGCDVVYGVREDRSSDFIGKKLTAEFFYKLLQYLNPHIIYNHGDFRLMSRRVLDALCDYPKDYLFLRGIIPRLGYPSAVISYTRKKRIKGKSKYSLIKMMGLAFDGIIETHTVKKFETERDR